MRMLKINNRFKRKIELGESDIYRKFSEQFDNLFNSDEVAKNKTEFENMYIPDSEFETQIDNFRNSLTHMVKFCVGYTGIGKTTSIRHCFGLGIRNETILNPDKKELVFPTFLDGYQIADMETFNLPARISSVCTKLEEEYPDLRELMSTDSGKTEFYDFLRKHSSHILETDEPIDEMDLSVHDLTIKRLKTAFKENPFEFQSNRLKFFITKKNTDIRRLIIILDDIETLPEEYQKQTICNFLRFQKCMQDTDFWDKQDYFVNLLISVRPHTYRILNSSQRISAFSFSRIAIMKKNMLDLDRFFEERFQYYTTKSYREIGNMTTWTDCYHELMNMNRVFAGKYKEMIQALCFFNIREALASYSKVFANRFWVQKNRSKESIFTLSSPEYTFNNINVIRALACNEEEVFWGDGDTVIPNLFYSTEKADFSVYCLLVLVYFVKKGGFDSYGINAETLGTVKKEWEEIFGNNITKKFIVALNYLFEKRVLRKSIKDIDDMKTLDKPESLSDKSRLYISPRGNELYEMLSRDSVLLEMLRESAWRDYEHRKYSELASYELMLASKQIEIFKDLYEYIGYLCEQEENILATVRTLGQLDHYRRVFTTKENESVMSVLLTGVKNSLDYSGIIHQENMNEQFLRLRTRIWGITDKF